MTGKIPFYQRITVRLIALFGTLVLVGGVAGSYTSIQLARFEFFHIMERQFNSTFLFAENSLDIIGQMARTWAFHFSGDRNLMARLAQSSPETMVQDVESIRGSAHCDSVIVLDRRGRVIHHGAFREKEGESLMGWQIVRQAINEQKTSYAIIEEAGNLMVYGSGMVAPAGNPAGPAVMLIGFKISDNLVSRLSRDTTIGLTFVRRTAVMASSFSTPQRSLVDLPISFLDYQTLLNDPHLSKEVRIAQRPYYASVRSLRLLDPAMDGSLLLTYPGSELDEIIERLQRKYLWLYALGMTLFALFIWRISSRIMAPLRKLEQRVQQVAQGDLRPTYIDRRDEIGSIASSFNDLLSELAESKGKVERHAIELEQMVERRTQELRQANEALTRLATHDSLTGLPNRKLFNDRLQQAIMLAHRSGANMAMMFVDLDRFKWVNDTYGHAAGDQLLQEVARRISSCLREGDTVARLGGDEFTVILSQTGTPEDIEEVAARLLQRMNEPFDLADVAGVQISASIGIAVYPADAEEAATLLLRADQAMYDAKRSGRAMYCFWKPELPPTDS